MLIVRLRQLRMPTGARNAYAEQRQSAALLALQRCDAAREAHLTRRMMLNLVAMLGDLPAVVVPALASPVAEPCGARWCWLRCLFLPSLCMVRRDGDKPQSLAVHLHLHLPLPPSNVCSGLWLRRRKKSRLRRPQ